MEYAADELKTEKCEYVDGINCRPDNAIQKFNETRRRFGRSGDRRVCYHGYQSFKQDEVDAKTAHEIGMELANRLWGDRFEVVVATHLDKSTHLHNHFVLNAVSFVDGKKYCNYKSDYEQMRKVSDEICRERGISVLENSPIHTPGNKNEVWAHKNGKVTHRDMIRADIEDALQYCENPDDLYKRLKSIGYTISKPREREHITIIAPGWQRPLRLDTLGFTKEYINSRLRENRDDYYFYDFNPKRKFRQQKRNLLT